MDRWILIFVGLTIILALVIIWLLKEKKAMIKDNMRMQDTIKENRTDIDDQGHEIDGLELSLKNANNAVEYTNKLIQKDTDYDHTYINIYQRELSYKDDFDRECSQIVYAVFYEDNFIYTMEYALGKHKDFDINRDAVRFKLECMLFIDGTYLEPSLNQHIEKANSTLKIEELNMYKHKGKGAGSFYLQCLSEEILRYPQIKYIRGDLSPVDIKYKDDLIGFYKKNGFQDIQPMTESEFGHVRKIIRARRKVS